MPNNIEQLYPCALDTILCIYVSGDMELSRTENYVYDYVTQNKKATRTEILNVFRTFSRSTVYRAIKKLTESGHLEYDAQSGYVYLAGEKPEPTYTPLNTSRKPHIYNIPSAMYDGVFLDANFPWVKVLSEVDNDEAVALFEQFAKKHSGLSNLFGLLLIFINMMQKNRRPLEILPNPTPPVGIEFCEDFLTHLNKLLDK